MRWGRGWSTSAPTATVPPMWSTKPSPCAVLFDCFRCLLSQLDCFTREAVIFVQPSITLPAPPSLLPSLLSKPSPLPPTSALPHTPLPNLLSSSHPSAHFFSNSAPFHPIPLYVTPLPPTSTPSHLLPFNTIRHPPSPSQALPLLPQPNSSPPPRLPPPYIYLLFLQGSLLTSHSTHPFSLHVNLVRHLPTFPIPTLQSPLYPLSSRRPWVCATCVSSTRPRVSLASSPVRISSWCIPWATTALCPPSASEGPCR